MSKKVVVVPGVGNFIGVSDGEVDQWKGLPFGIVESRFSLPVPANGLGDVDCSQQGPLAPQHKPYDDDWNGVEHPHPFKRVYDERSCLNMMITAPSTVTSPIPVVVWIHGGSNNAGTAYRGSNDPADWVRTSTRAGKPIMVATPQFRLNLFGFLAINGKGNWAMYDQLLVGEWVKNNISYFGGDPTKVTIAGQSAGAACALVQSQHPRSPHLYSQAALLSGSLRTLHPRSLSEYEDLGRRIAAQANVPYPEGLYTAPWHVLTDACVALGVEIWNACDDGQFLAGGGNANESPYKSVPRVRRLIISDCAEDGFYLRDDQQALEIVHATRAEVSTPDELARYLTTVIFAKGAALLASEFDGPVFHQLLDGMNPVDPRCGNNHMVELHYIMHAYRTLPEFDTIIHDVQVLWASLVRHEWNGRTTARITDHIEANVDIAQYRDFKLILDQSATVTAPLARHLRGW